MEYQNETSKGLKRYIAVTNISLTRLFKCDKIAHKEITRYTCHKFVIDYGEQKCDKYFTKFSEYNDATNISKEITGSKNGNNNIS